MSHPTTLETTKSDAVDTVDSEKTQAGEMSPDHAVEPAQSKTDNVDKKQSTLQTVLLIISVFLAMFLVIMDRTIVSTV